MSAWLIRGARVLDPAGSIDAEADVRVVDGLVREVGPALDADGARSVDARGLWLLPGLVELRARAPGGGGQEAALARELRAAAAGGITTLALLPAGGGIDAGAAARVLREARAGIGPRVVPMASLAAPGEPPLLTELGLLKGAGCAAAVQGGRALPAQILRRALEYAAGAELPVLLDAQDGALAAAGCAHEGAVAVRLGLAGVPVAAEELALARGLTLARLSGARVHFAGVSSAAGVALLREARATGLPVSGDTGLWHLCHTDADIGDFDTAFHLQPPLRESADRAALREAVADGTLGVVSADHYAHAADAKTVPFARSAPGAAGFEALLPVLAGLADAGVPLPALLAAVTAGPARLLGVPGGTLAPGAPADLCLYDPAQVWIVGADTWLSGGHSTPVWGEALRGRVCATLVGGRPVHDSQALFA